MAGKDPGAGLADRPPITAASASVVAGEAKSAFAFGRFRLFPVQRRLFAGNEPIELGARAFDTLLALAEAGGELVTRKDLLKRVWGELKVADHSIDAQISALRRALGPDRDLIQTVTGVGLHLAASVTAIPEAPVATTNLPIADGPLVGRERELAELKDLIAAHRLVTLTGAGGIGKTTLGLEAARGALAQFADGVWLVELGSLVDPKLIAGAIARALGVEPGSNRHLLDQLVSVLQSKHLLLVLDNCEHLIGAVARIAQALLRGVPRLHILATSQERLAAKGEHICYVDPLEVPPTDIGNAAQALEHGAVQLFVECAWAADSRFSWDDRVAGAVSHICRQLDGIPLAIELAASCTAVMGHDVLASLDDCFRMLKKGPHTALPRHQTLRAALDWSFGLLTEAERAVLRRLAIFADGFALEGAAAVAAGKPIRKDQVAIHIAGLVNKSLVTFEARGPARRYRLLETTRAYAKEKLAKSGELAAVARRHADYHRVLMERAEADWQATPAPELVERYAPEIDNIRAALDWAFEPHGDPKIGVALTAASIPLWTLLSTLGECRDLIDQALSRLDQHSVEQLRHEMVLQTARARSSMLAKGPSGAASSASERALELAEHLEDTDYQLRALYILWIYRLRTGAFRTSLAIAERFREIAEQSTDRAGILTGARLEGASLFYLGEHSKARACLEHVVNDDDSNMRRSFVVRFCADQRVVALVYLARILWHRGFPDQAARMAHACVEEARLSNHAHSLCLALSDGACGIAAMSGDLQAVEELTAVLIDCAERHGLGMRLADGLAYKGWIAARRGNSVAAIDQLRRALEGFVGAGIKLHRRIPLEGLTQALAAAGRTDEALAMIHEALEEQARHEGRWSLPELLRMRGELVLRQGLAKAAVAAEKDFLEALEVARSQGALSWQLRAATSLARLWRTQCRDSEARDVLVPVYERFTEGFETADLKAAKAVIDLLQVGGSGPS